MSKLVKKAYSIMAKCDLINGRITDMTKDQIEDTWSTEELIELIRIGKQTIQEHENKNCGL